MDENNFITIKGYAAKLKNGHINISTKKQTYVKFGDELLISTTSDFNIEENIYPNLKWGDEPQEIELYIKNK